MFRLLLNKLKGEKCKNLIEKGSKDGAKPTGVTKPKTTGAKHSRGRGRPKKDVENEENRNEQDVPGKDADEEDAGCRLSIIPLKPVLTIKKVGSSIVENEDGKGGIK